MQTAGQALRKVADSCSADRGADAAKAAISRYQPYFFLIAWIWSK